MPHHQAGVQADVAVLSSQQLPKRPMRMSPPLRLPVINLASGLRQPCKRAGCIFARFTIAVGGYMETYPVEDFRDRQAHKSKDGGNAMMMARTSTIQTIEMHRALQIPELVELVFSCIPRSDLALLARTCKKFQEPALDNVWNYQSTFAYILGCMPEDLWDSPVHSVPVDELDVVRPIVPLDWDRPLFYLSRVRTLDLDFTEDLPSEELFQTLVLCLPEEHLFPNLRSLAWMVSDPALFPYIRILLGPRLTKLDTKLTASMPHLSLIPTIAVKCPCLTDAGIYWDEPPLDIHQFLRQTTSLFVQTLTRIETLRVNDLDQAAFEHLASLSTLKSLTLENLDYFPRVTSPPRLSDTPRFSALHRLEIWPGNLEVAIALIRALSGSPVASLDMTILVSPALAAISSLYRSVADSFHATLREIRIYACDPDDVVMFLTSPPEEYRIPADVLRLWFCFQNLTEIWLQYYGGFDLDDGLVLEMARAWPHLQSINIMPSSPTPVPRRVTVGGLSVFAHYCPDLVLVGIEVDATIIPAPGHQHPHTKLEVLNVGYSPIADPSTVADFIFGIFPAIAEIRATNKIRVDANGEHTDTALDFSRRWSTVGDEFAQKRRTLSKGDDSALAQLV
ncbi:hypothetical protein B0H17DRAFT_1197656 [Mycena rosella]|uniref:F-box domain-containing protein n=1 Tax=Mycena rosella TaxID=1033263 RepID=A0AAD7DQE7_MYCRO|nr:hypothetical protein B0H17DRAFT_1197656 [Mycena rosella]